MNTTTSRLDDLGITLPQLTLPAAAYVPWRRSGSQIWVSGQLPLTEQGPLHVGRVGEEVTLEEGQAAARQCALNILSHLHTACDGDLDRIKQVIRLEILVATAPDFIEPHVVANGASSLILDVLGETVGAHARVAYGVAVLPMHVPVEVAAVVDAD